jgi:thiosulfate/3-mercaptopyruvate sulfurtransferase
MSDHKFIIEPAELELLRKQDDVVIIDLCAAAQYITAHIPEAHYLPYPHIVRSEKPVMGLLPDEAVFSRLLSNLGINKNTHIIAYDDEGGGCASRLVWTLYVFGHTRASLLDGGIVSWLNEDHEVSALPPVNNRPSQYTLTNTGNETADAQYIRQKLGSASTALLDARSEAEYSGAKKFAAKGGHIPGAIHYEWTEAINRNNNMRLQPAVQILNQLNALGLSKDKEIICYCQSHHRSAYSWLMLRTLGYDNVKGYPGSWSDWGNRADTPVE